MLVTIFKYASWRKNKQGEHLATARVEKSTGEAPRVTVNKKTQDLRDYLKSKHGALTVNIEV